MRRILSGVAAMLLLVTAGTFFWRGQAESRVVIPAAPMPRLAALTADTVQTPPLLRASRLAMPPAATARTREEKRFGRTDKDDDGRITRLEMLAPRQKAFVRLDKDGDGRLAFDEWAVKTVGKFDGADGNRDGALTAVEYAATAPKARAKTACRC